MQPISKATLTKMREAYEQTIRKTSTENLKKRFPERPWIEETSSTWVSRKDLDKLLNTNNADGLRIYYGCHYKSTHMEPILDYLGLHNLIFVATKDGVDAQDPQLESSIDQLKDTVTTADNETDEPVTYDGSAGDVTALCPPRCT